MNDQELGHQLSLNQEYHYSIKDYSEQDIVSLVFSVLEYIAFVYSII